MSSFGSFGEFLWEVRKAELAPHATDPRLTELNKRGVGGASGASEAVPSDGGFLVPPEVSRKLVERVYADSEVLSRVTTVPLTKGEFEFPQFDEQSRANGSRFGGLRGYWANEADSATVTNSELRRSTLTAHKLIILTYLTEEMLRDTDAMGIFVEAGFRKEAEFKLVDAIINGDGAGKPSGILNPANQALIQVAKDSGQSSGTLNGDNITGMWGRLWPGSTKNAVWLASKTAEQALSQMTIAVGSGGSALPLYRDGLLFGRPVIPIEQCPQIGTPGDILLADLSRYLLGMRTDGQLDVSIHVNFNTDEAVFRFVMRVDGATLDHTPVTPFDGSANTTSPFVAVAKR